MSKDPAVLFYTSDFLSGTFTMSNDHVGMYIKLLCLQHQKGRLTEEDMKFVCNGHVKDVFDKFKVNGDGLYYNERMEEESLKRQAFCESRRKSIQQRYVRSTNEEHTNIRMENENVNVNINDVVLSNQSSIANITINKKEKNSNMIIPPKKDDVSAYCKERDNGIDPDRFINFYESKGWMIGKNKMKNWKAAVRTWEKHEKPNNGWNGKDGKL